MNSGPTARAEPPPKSSSAMFIVRLVCTAIFIAILVLSVDWPVSFAILGKTNILLCAALVPLYFASLGAAALRCQLLFTGLGFGSVSLGQVYRYYLLSSVVSQFLPSTVGGDVVRVVGLGRRNRSVASGLSVIVLERVTGVATLLLWVLIPFALQLSLFRDSVVLNRLGWSLVALVIAGTAFVVFYGNVMRHKKWAIAKRFPWLTRAGRAVAQIYESGLLLLSKPKLLLPVMLCSFARITAGCFSIYCFLVAIDSPVPLLTALIIGAAADTIALIPLSVAGLGLREGALVVLLAEAGVTREAAMAVGLLGRLCLMVCLVLSVPSAWLALRDLRSDKGPESEAGEPDDHRPTAT
jgi:glycosyltransferase 2 family protein